MGKPKKAKVGKVSSTKLPKKDGATFVWSALRWEAAPRCRACQEVVPLPLWWKHQCAILTPPE